MDGKYEIWGTSVVFFSQNSVRSSEVSHKLIHIK